MSKVIDARTPRGDTRPQRSDHGIAEVCALRRAETAGRAQWVDAGAMSQYSRVLHATGPGLDTYIMMFNDKDACQLAMSMIEK